MVLVTLPLVLPCEQKLPQVDDDDDGLLACRWPDSLSRGFPSIGYHPQGYGKQLEKGLIKL